MSNDQTKNSLFVNNDCLKRYKEAYVYGTAVPMQWLESELLKIKALVGNNALIVICEDEQRLYVTSLEDFYSWLDTDFPELRNTM